MTDGRGDHDSLPPQFASAAPPHEPPRWLVPLVLFCLTVLSTFYVGARMYSGVEFPSRELAASLRGGSLATIAGTVLRWLALGWKYAVPLMAILLCHEFGHFIMARRHHVPATLPMFIPIPLPPFGTMGAVIRMKGDIRTRDSLLDIGAAGPLAGLAIAIPVTFIGLRLSPVNALPLHGAWTQEGQSILYALLKFAAKGVIPEDHDVFLHPTAMAGWVGLLVTMMNLIPYGQLDGGHVAYALLHDRLARFLKWEMVAILIVGLVSSVYSGMELSRAHRSPWELGTGYSTGLNWLVFLLLIRFLHRGTSGRHPPTEPGELSPGRRVVAWVTLAFLVLLFMPIPLRFVER